MKLLEKFAMDWRIRYYENNVTNNVKIHRKGILTPNKGEYNMLVQKLVCVGVYLLLGYELYSYY